MDAIRATVDDMKEELAAALSGDAASSAWGQPNSNVTPALNSASKC